MGVEAAVGAVREAAESLTLSVQPYGKGQQMPVGSVGMMRFPLHVEFLESGEKAALSAGSSPAGLLPWRRR